MTADHTNSLVATYYIEAQKDLASVAETLASIETTGGDWPFDRDPTPFYAEARGAVLDVSEAEPGKGTISIALPLVSLNLDDSAFSSLWLTMIGGATHALLDYEKSRLVDFSLPESAYRHFPGPRFGQDGIRDILGVPRGTPIIGTIVKPTQGLTAEDVADLCYTFAANGLRFIKDDEKMLNVAYCPLEKRVRLVVEKLRKAEDETGRKCMYAPHITTGPENILRYAETAVKLGASGLMFNLFAASFHSFRLLVEADIGVPLYAHCGGKEALGRAPGQGVSPEVIVKFARLMGGDIFRSSIIGGYLVGGSLQELHAVVEAMRSPLPGIRDMFPAFSGGLKPSNVGENVTEFGTDIMLLAGSGIVRYPGGIKAGAEAMLAEAAVAASGRRASG